LEEIGLKNIHFNRGEYEQLKVVMFLNSNEITVFERRGSSFYDKDVPEQIAKACLDAISA
jgi:hypothetical protein